MRPASFSKAKPDFRDGRIEAFVDWLTAPENPLFARVAERFGDLVPVLITRDSKKTQKRHHGRHSAAHLILLYVLGEIRRRIEHPGTGHITAGPSGVSLRGNATVTESCQE